MINDEIRKVDVDVDGLLMMTFARSNFNSHSSLNTIGQHRPMIILMIRSSLATHFERINEIAW